MPIVFQEKLNKNKPYFNLVSKIESEKIRILLNSLGTKSILCLPIVLYVGFLKST